MSNMTNKTVFVSVGTTEFDDLIKTSIDCQILQELVEKGYSKIILQIGNGKPPELPLDTVKRINIEFYRFKPSLTQDFKNADLIISHAGAGTCLEVLNIGKPLIVVVNEKLMNNHQSELAEALHQRGHVIATIPSRLLEALRDFQESKLLPYPSNDPKVFSTFLNGVMNVKS